MGPASSEGRGVDPGVAESACPLDEAAPQEQQAADQRGANRHVQFVTDAWGDSVNVPTKAERLCGSLQRVSSAVPL